jgi:hypothetical protein
MDDRILEFLDGRSHKLVQAVLKHGSERKAAKALGLSHGTVSGVVTRAKAKAAKRGWSPEYGLEHPCPPGQFVKGVSTLYNADGEVNLQWVKTNANLEDMAETLRVIAESLAEGSPSAKPIKKPKGSRSDQLATHYKIGDLHLGLYAWAQETLAEDWDVHKATSHVKAGIRYLTEASPDSKIGVILNVGDWFHINDRSNSTPRSKNALDVDTRYGKVIQAGVDIMKSAVSAALENHDEVHIVNAPGNHDPDATVWLALLLTSYYEDEPRVTVWPSDSPWALWTHGKVAVAVNHGIKKRQAQYEFLTRQFRREFGGAEHIYVDNGHIHHKQVEEIGGIMFESWNVIPPVDAWHAEMGYGAKRSLTSVTYDKEFGEVSRNVCDIRMIRKILEE